MAANLTLYQINQTRQFKSAVRFVELGMLSIISVMNDGGSVEVAAIGNEGMVGAFLLLCAKTIPYRLQGTATD